MFENFKDIDILKWIYIQSKNQRSKILFLVIMNGFYALTVTSFALICKKITDSAINKNRDQILINGLILILIIVGQFILKIFLNSFSEYIRSKLSMNYRQKIFSEILKKKYEFVSKFHSGELLNRIFSDTQIIIEGIISILPSFTNIIIRIFSAGILLTYLDKKFSLFFISSGIIFFVVTKFFRKKLKSLHKDVQEKEGILRSFLQEALEKIIYIKSFSVEKKVETKCETLQNNYFKSRMKRRGMSIMSNASFSFVFEIWYILAIIWGSFNIYQDKFSYGTLLAILQLINQIRVPFANLSGFLPRIYTMIASGERIIELEFLSDEKTSSSQLKYKDFKKLIVKNLSFNYGENSVLENINFEINRGDIISLRGISGGGKSTIFLLLMGIFESKTGEIKFLTDDKIYDTGFETRKIFGYVPQGNQLFSGTIKENICFLSENPSEEEIILASQVACASDFIDKLPNKYDTVIGENGSGISEGQAQRIAIARAILSGAEFLLLDEATSALDEETEGKVLENISKLKNKTCIIVTHRKSALSICSRHFYFYDKKLFEK